MTPGGWITLCLSVGFVTTLFVWCLVRVLTRKGPDDTLHGVDNIDTQDD